MSEKTVILAEDSGLGKVGQRVTLALQPSDVHDASELPTYLAGYKPFQYRADEMSPVVHVDNDQDKYRTFSSDDAFRAVDVKNSIMGKVPEVDPSSSLATYTVIERTIGSFIPEQTMSQRGNSYDPRMAAARRCRRAIDLDREIDVTTLLDTSTNFASTQRTAVGANGEWNEGTASNPIKDLETAIQKSAQQVTDIWMNQKVAFAFLRNPEVKDHMRQFYGDAAPNQNVSSTALANGRSIDFQIPGFPPIHVVASKVKNESTSALDYTFGDVCVLTHTPPGTPTDGEDISTSYTFRRRGPSGTGYEVREFRVEDRGSLGGTMVVVTMADLAVMTGNTVGGIITGVHS